MMENHEMKTEEENNMMKIKEENNMMKIVVKEEYEEVKVEEHQEPDLHPLITTNRTDPASSSGPSDLQVEKMTQKRKAPARSNKDTEQVVKKRLTYDPSGPWTSTTIIGAPPTGRPRLSLRTKKRKTPTLRELRSTLKTCEKIIDILSSKTETLHQVAAVAAVLIQRIQISGRRSTYYSWKVVELLETCQILLAEISQLSTVELVY